MAGLLLATAGLFSSGCSSMNSGSLESLEGTQLQLLGDIPIQPGSKIDNTHSLILGGGPNWTGRAMLVTPQGPTETFTFFREQFSSAGWTGVSSIKAKTSVLVFIKQERTITVEITESGGLSNGSVVLLTASPKAGSVTPQNNNRATR